MPNVQNIRLRQRLSPPSVIFNAEAIEVCQWHSFLLAQNYELSANWSQIDEWTIEVSANLGNIKHRPLRQDFNENQRLLRLVPLAHLPASPAPDPVSPSVSMADWRRGKRVTRKHPVIILHIRQQINIEHLAQVAVARRLPTIFLHYENDRRHKHRYHLLTILRSRWEQLWVGKQTIPQRWIISWKKSNESPNLDSEAATRALYASPVLWTSAQQLIWRRLRQKW